MLRLNPSYQRLSIVVFLFFLAVFIVGLSKAAEPDFLPPEEAFQFSSKQISPDKVEVTFHIADGYYMYRERFHFKATGVELGEVILPRGHIKFDENFQKDVETFRKLITIQIPISSIDKSKPSFTLITQSQGCSDEGLCYVPMESKQSFSTVNFLVQGGGFAEPTATDLDDASKLRNALRSGSLLVIVPLFAALGLILAFSPCLLPMVPILSSIILGEGAGVNRSRGFILSFSYSLGMAVVYTALGIAAGLMGEGLAAMLQNPWVLGTFSLLLVGLSLSMFNVYHLQLPSILQNKLAHFSERHRTGKLLGVFIMGAISALIVGPCVAAPLVSALLYISQTRDVYIGGAALFSMAIGMSVPLLLVGLSAGYILPRVGSWMESVKHFFGVLMLALALWMISPVLPVWLHMVGWSLLFIGYGIFLFRQPMLLIKVVALIFCALGLIELVGVTTGGREVLAPVAHLTGKSQAQHVEFQHIKSIAELDNALAQAKHQGKSVMLDFYADWCVSCKEMEKFTFTDSRVKAKFTHMVLLQADVTANNDDDRALLKRFNLYGPPGMIFFGLNSEEAGRVIGFQNADKFLNSMASFEKAQ